jgi:hypothetical protein
MLGIIERKARERETRETTGFTGAIEKGSLGTFSAELCLWVFFLKKPSYLPRLPNGRRVYGAGRVSVA